MRISVSSTLELRTKNAKVHLFLGSSEWPSCDAKPLNGLADAHLAPYVVSTQQCSRRIEYLVTHRSRCYSSLIPV